MLLLSAAACGEGESKSVQATAAGDDAGPARPPERQKSPEEIRYDGTISGLERLMRDLRVALTSNDESTSAVLIASLRLPEYEAWMLRVFGNELGRALSDEYRPQSEEIGLLAEVLTEQYGKGLVDAEAYRFVTSEVLTSTGYQSAALKQMTETVPLYSVRLYSEDRKRSFHLWSFVHEAGSFRYVGKLRAVAPKRASGGRDLNEYRLEDAERLAAQENK